MKTQPPPGEAPGKKDAVAAMFDDIAPRYDLLNRVLSFGIDQHWRDRAIALLGEDKPRRILDVATGTADIAIKALTVGPDKIVGVDISDEMLERGREKIRDRGLSDQIVLQIGDAERLPFSDSQFDAVVVAFGVRNFESLEQGLSEILRVLSPGGRLVVLEFSHPRSFPIKPLYKFYSHVVLPAVGRAVSKNDAAYRYLPASVDAFPSGEDFLRRLRDVGFVNAVFQPLTFGITALYSAYKTVQSEG
jgi:demethylmenaquinone methyltransferase/2-methoxy-6-polyprenyl-1,4-benzoquinol methylase